MTNSLVCKQCGETKPHTAEFFYVADSRTKRLGPRCKSCCIKNAVQRKRDNPERTKRDAKKYRTKNSKSISEASKKRRIAHLEEYRAKNREWIKGNPEKARAACKRWRRAHPERQARADKNYRNNNPLAIRAKAHRRRALKRGAPGICTADDIQRLLATQKGRCYYCGEKRKLTVDHVVPLSRGGSNEPSNLVLACKHCNSSKCDKLPHEWIEGGRLL